MLPTVLIERGSGELPPRGPDSKLLQSIAARKEGDGAADRDRSHRHGLDGARPQRGLPARARALPGPRGAPPTRWWPPTSARTAARHAERVGFERTTADWRAVIDNPEVEVVNVTLPNVMHREVAVAARRPASTCGSRSRSGAGSRTPPPSPTPCAARASSPGSASVTASRPPSSTPGALIAAARSARSTTTAASSSPTTRTAPTPPPRGASSAPPPARARSAT